MSASQPDAKRVVPTTDASDTPERSDRPETAGPAPPPLPGPANDDVDALMGEVHEMLVKKLETVEDHLMRLSTERDAILVRLECVEEALGQRRSRRSELLGGRLRSPADLTRLSEREQEVFHLIGRGGSTREIADRLGVQQTTVETYIRRIRAKLEIESFHELRYIATVWLTVQPRNEP